MGRRLLELGFATGLAIAQPLFDLLGRNPEFLVAHRLEGAGLVLFAIAVATLPAVGLWLLELLVHLVAPRAASLLHSVMLTLLFGATVLAPLHRAFDGPAIVLIATATVTGAALAILVARASGARRILGFGAIAVPLIVALFLLRPEVRELVAASVGDSGAAGGASSDTPVLVVVLDALPLASILDNDGQIDAGKFPNLALLASDAVWFRNASTNSDFTVRAIPALLSGRLPANSAKAHWSEYPDNLFTMLGNSHEIVAAEAVTAVCPPSLDRGAGGGWGELVGDVSLVYLHAILPGDLRDDLPPVDQGWRAFGHGREGILGQGSLGQRVAHIDRFVARLGEVEGTRPPLAFLHAEIPHRPYGLYPSGKFYSSTGREPGGRTEKGRRVRDQQVVDHARQRHLLQASYVDNRLGDILATWRQIGAYERSVIVVTSDHGVSFEPGEMARHLSPTNHAAVLPVPLLVKFPSGDHGGEIRDENIELIDVVPMIAGASGISPGYEVDGEDPLAPDFAPRPTKRVVHHSTGQISEIAPDLYSGALAIAQEHVGRPGSPAAALIGQPLSSLRTVPPRGGSFGMDSPTSVTISATDQLIPGEAFGFIGVDGESYLDQVVVVTVDGIVAATTRPYPPWPGQTDAPWYALLPEDMLDVGDHLIEAWLVSRDAEGLVLHPTFGDRIMPSYLGIPLGRISYLGVETSGLREGKPRATSQVRFVVPMRPDERPRTLDARIDALDPASTHLAISVNGTQVFQGSIGLGTWRQRLTLPPLVLGETVTIEINGDPEQIDAEADWTFGQIEVRLGK